MHSALNLHLWVKYANNGLKSPVRGEIWVKIFANLRP
jgi:hypothetical protein